MTQFASLFSALEDPRASNARRYSLHDILVIAFGAMLCGGQTGANMDFSATPNGNSSNPSSN